MPSGAQSPTVAANILAASSPVLVAAPKVVEASLNTLASSDIEEFGIDHPILAGESIPVPEDSIDVAVRAPALPAKDYTQELRNCYSISDDRDYSAAKQSAL